jgi:hypothetical protein
MIIITRILVAVIGVIALLGVGQHWFDLDAVAAERGMQAIGDVGRANLRADVGGLFLGISGLALFAAVRQHQGAILAATVLLGATLIGRFVSIAIDGYSAAVAPPMIVEAILIAILLFVYRAWGKKPEGL